MGVSGVDGRRPRTDKQRNRLHILEVAEQFFAEHGITGSSATMADTSSPQALTTLMKSGWQMPANTR
ncbi:hypothetical protein [Streptomyces paludis]|uniref:hypothetical protein n=1 Tax=Streptomyces paludis TaxID=2282738 RepID=UPI0015F2B71A|nr:hypothetical protein [Streptomyces paludis]